ncbi:MAG TPA: putative O-glycosylation ligase, exosortase A system-associated [Burkholderiales bacterium]|nr:putative O-glycosylation ligase, exosortase A system-associated [Burkholderiales bacterium]
MRDILVTAIVFGSLPFILWRPYVGVLVWTWLAFMNPHRLTWSFAYYMPFALVVALATLCGLFFSRAPKKVPWTRETVLLLVFVAWMTITTIFAVYPTLAWPQLDKVAKIILMVYVTMILMQTRERINQLMWVIALSLAFYGVKGGIFTIVHGGIYHVRGPAGSFIGGDNEMGLALVMAVPLLRYLQLTTQRVWLKHLLTAAMVLTALAAIGSQSRGAFLGIVAMGTFFWLKSRAKLFSAILAVVAIVSVFAIMPEQWFERMRTIETYESDDSAAGRINAWKMAINLAKSRPLGGGFDAFQPEMFAMYAPEPDNVHDAHSIYFETLGEHGFVGLALFLAIALLTWRTASSIIKKTRGDPERRWGADLAAMVQVSLIGYASAGAFLGLAYFDLYYTLVAVIILCKTVLTIEERRALAGSSEDGRQAAVPARSALARATS